MDHDLSFNKNRSTHGSHGSTSSSLRHRIVGLSAFAALMLLVTVSVVSLFPAGSTWATDSDKVMFTQVVVGPGDTLWSIARRHGPQNRDIRETIDRIRAINGLDSPLLRPGARLLVPVS